MTLEQKWDLLWPLACAVTHAVERYDNPSNNIAETWRNGDTLAHMARQLKKAVDRISPEPQSSAKELPNDQR
jgi:hypothetical protein